MQTKPSERQSEQPGPLPGNSYVSTFTFFQSSQSSPVWGGGASSRIVLDENRAPSISQIAEILRPHLSRPCLSGQQNILQVSSMVQRGGEGSEEMEEKVRKRRKGGIGNEKEEIRRRKKNRRRRGG